MPKKEYRQTEYAKLAKKKAKSKVIQVRFELNIPQTKKAEQLDLESYGVTSIHTLAKKLFLEHMNKKQ